MLLPSSQHITVTLIVYPEGTRDGDWTCTSIYQSVTAAAGLPGLVGGTELGFLVSPEMVGFPAPIGPQPANQLAPKREQREHEGKRKSP